MLSKFKNIKDEYKSEMNNERLSLIPTLVTESNEINNKDVINKNNAKISTINNDNLSSSLSYNSISDSMLQDDDNNQSILEELEKEKNKEVIIIFNYFSYILLYLIEF